MKPGQFPAVSVIAPVLNEADHLAGAVAAVLEQSYSGEIELILALGPSRDGTNEIAEKLAAADPRIHLIDNPTGRTANALNLAIKKSKFDYIVRIDGHSEIDSQYIATAIATLRDQDAVNVGGVMAAEGKTNFQKAVARAMRSFLGVGNSRFHIGGSAGEVDTVYLGVFKKSALLAAGGFDERFTRAQDWELNFRLRKSGGKIWFNPNLKVIYRPRKNLRLLSKQYFEYGRWRRAVSRQHQGTINLRYLAPPLALLISCSSIALAILFSWQFIAPVFLYFLLIKIGSLIIGKSWSERGLLPLVITVMHFSWGLGFLTSPKSLLKT
jgi:glycosyltransferase involved in cell wall biosynthesis